MQPCIPVLFWVLQFAVAFSPQRYPRHDLPLLQATTSSSSTSSTTSQTLPETHPLAPHTFAGMVEAGIVERFGNTADRVLTSWRLTEQDYTHTEFIGTSVSSTTTQGDTSMCYQEAHSYVPGLTIRPFWDEQEQPWAYAMQSKYKAIRDEFLTVTANLEELTQSGNNIWAGALTQDASSYGDGWKTLVLMDRGVWDPVNVNLFPVAAQAVLNAKVPAVEVFFASMKPHSTIEPHSDNTNFVLTSHVALDIPYSGENKCRLTIADQTKEWINGEVMLFDTSLLHDASNDSDLTRYILMMRIWHPDLTTNERGALQFIFDALNAPEIVTASTSEERLQVEQAMQQARVFPAITAKAKQGFGAAAGNAKKTKPKKKKK
jgi:aspartyl/asparaginyl beta-hydroxylase (cupin superfamily)